MSSSGGIRFLLMQTDLFDHSDPPGVMMTG